MYLAVAYSSIGDQVLWGLLELILQKTALKGYHILRGAVL